MIVQVEQQQFDFPSGWDATKYDDWRFYRDHFAKALGGGVKAVDVLALAPDSTLWFIEVKDYRWPNPTIPLPSDLAKVVAQKIFCTSAALLPAATLAAIAHERVFAGQALGATTIRAVLHMEQPAPTSLGPAISKADVLQKLRKLLRGIDPNAIVVDSAAMGSLLWTVT